MAENDSVTIDGRQVFLIRIPKNASRSMAKALGLAVVGQHKPRNLLEEQVNSECPLFVACLRNPFERLVSWHSYHSPLDPSTYFGAGIYGFREWIEHGCPHKFYACCPQAHPFEQARWIKGYKGELALLNFEDLANDWRELFGMPLPWINKSRHGKWREYYDAATMRQAECIVWVDTLGLM